MLKDKLPEACRADKDAATLVNPKSIDKAPNSIDNPTSTMRLERWTRDHLNKSSQSISRPVSAEPPSTVHPQGISNKHYPWVRIEPIVKICRCLNVLHLVTHRRNVAVSFYRTIGCHQDILHALQVQIHETTPRVDWKEQTGTSKMTVSPYSNLPDSLSYDCLLSARPADSNPRNNASGGLDGTDRDTKNES